MREHQSAKCAGTDAIKTVSSTPYIYVHALVLGSIFPTQYSSELFTYCVCCVRACVCQQSKIALAFVLIIANYPGSLLLMYFISFGYCVQLTASSGFLVLVCWWVFFSVLTF